MALEDGDSELDHHLEQYKREKRLEKLLADARMLAEETQRAAERAKEITSALHPPEDPSGEKAPRT